MSIERDQVKLRKRLVVKPPRPLTSVIAAFLIKLAKHTALLTGLVIVSVATGRPAVSEVGIFLMAVTAAVIYSLGCALARRLPTLTRLPRGGP
ncbi:MAG TPA: hypothetical protein VH985_05510 [Candidatus Binatia bacterium]|jgi:hypothetical protein